MNANYITDDEIDFRLYMGMSDHDHKVRPASDYAEEVQAFFHSPEEEAKGARLPFKKAARCIRFRPHEVTLWGGYNGHGKSLLLGQAVIGFAMQGQKSCIASMEMRPVTTLARMARQASAANKPDREFISEFCATMGLGLYLYDQQGMVDTDKIIAVIRYAAEKKGCEHFVIDSLMKCGLAEDDYNRQKHFVDQLCTVARDTGIHVHLVGHCRKGKDELTPPGKADIRGAASITDQVDNAIVVWRNKQKEADIEQGRAPRDSADAYMLVQKQRNGEWEGSLKMWFHQPSQQFLEADTGYALDLINPAVYK